MSSHPLNPLIIASFQTANVDFASEELTHFQGQPLFSQAAVDFDSVCEVLLGLVPIPNER